jgi:predicted nucleic acid-binding protein
MEWEMRYLFDTNILIYYFNGSLSEDIKKEISEMLRQNFTISVISKMEFLGFSKFTSEQKEQATQFLSFAKVIPLEDDIVDSVIKMKQRKNIKLPDAIIAATALSDNLHLVTRNVEDFKSIKIKIVNPFEK